jgi:5-methyltetrahydropteroyltriglutamate--homocysteine methyltransferase
VPEGGLGIIDEFKYTMAHTDKPLKATCAGPLTFGSRIHPGSEYKGTVDIAERFCEVINAELKGLVAAGAEFIQIDEPARGNLSGEEMGRLFNKATEGVNAKLAFHICFGNRFGRSRFERVYSNYFPGVLNANAHQFVLEFAGRELSELEKVGEWFSADRELGAGLIDVKGFYTDTPEDVAKRINKALQYIKPEKLWVNPDCGFGWSPRYMCNQKIGALAAGAKLAREQLGR